MRRFRLSAVFVVAATAFFAVRTTQPLVWNDTPQTAENLYGFGDEAPPSARADAICRDEGAFGLRWRDPGVVKRIAVRSFSCLEFGGYRPLSAVLSHTGVAVWSDATEIATRSYLGTMWIAGVAGLFGALAVLLFLVARPYLQTDAAALVVLLLFFLSPPVLSGAWILFSGGIQVTVPLLICLGLWLYRKGSEATDRRWLWRLALVVVLFTGPWIREFTGIVAILVALLELQRRRRPTWLCGIAALAFVHALFPTLLVAPFVPRLPVIPVFQLGSLAAQLATGGGSLTTALTHLKWEVAKVFLVVLPPMLFAISAVLVAGSLRRNAVSGVAVAVIAITAVLYGRSPWIWMFLIVAFSACTVLQALGRSRESRDALGVADVVFLNVWFLLSFLPFLKVFSAHVHLAYPLIPATILLAAATERFWVDLVREEGISWRKVLLLPLLLVAVLDQSLNAYGSYATVNTLYDGIEYMARWMRSNVPDGSVVVANALHVEDIRLYSHNHIRPYWSVIAGVPAERTVEEPQELERLLQRHFGSTAVLMLDINQRFSPLKGDYHAHKYITRKSVKVDARGRVHESSVRFPFVDPLRLLLPREMVLFLGPPDLENDVYSGPAQSGASFLREMSVAYDVYTVIDPAVSRNAYYLPDSTFLYPRLLEARGAYRLYGYRDSFVAVPGHIPADEATLARASESEGVLRGGTIQELRAKVDATRTR